MSASNTKLAKTGFQSLYILLFAAALFSPFCGRFQDIIFAAAVGGTAAIPLCLMAKDKSRLYFIAACMPYVLLVFHFLLTDKLDGDSWRTHFPKFNFMCDAIANGHYFPRWFPSSGGIRLGYFHINFNQTLPPRMLGYALAHLLPVSTVFAYKLQYAIGVLFMSFGWWLVLRQITISKISAYFGVLMILMGGTGITFHHEHALVTASLIPWFVLAALKLRATPRYLLAATIVFGLGLSAHYPQIQFISMGLVFMALFLSWCRPFPFRMGYAPLVVLLLFLSILPALYVLNSSDILASMERQAYDTLRTRSYQDYLRLHRPTFSAAPLYFVQYLASRWSLSPSDPYPIDILDRCSFFVGRIGVILAAAGVILAFRKTLPILVLLVAFASLALGMYGPVPAFLYAIHFPFIDVFRQWVHFFPMVNFSLSALAAIGIDRLLILCGKRSAKYARLVIVALVFFQTLDLAAYGNRYISLYLEKAVPADMRNDFYRQDTPESGVFQYRNRLALYRSCGNSGIPDDVFITTDIFNLPAGEDEDVAKICALLSTGNAGAIIAAMPTDLDRFFVPGKRTDLGWASSRPGYDGLAVEAVLKQPALLVTPLNYDLGAEACVNGEKTKTLRVNAALTGLLLDRGRQVIQFTIPADAYWPLARLQWALYLLAGVLFFSGRKPRPSSCAGGKNGS